MRKKINNGVRFSQGVQNEKKKGKNTTMQIIKENPFSKLDTAEIESDAKFVSLFSDCTVNSCIELYKHGNVIISGIEGSGKSMLLSLLKPGIQISYLKSGKEFPVSEKFLGAGINFTRSGLMDIASRIVSRLEFGDQRKQDAPQFFGDFINYWVVKDIIKSVTIFKEKLNDAENKQILNLDRSDKTETEFVRIISKSLAWSGYLEGVKSIKELLDRLDKRIYIYRHIATASHPKSIPEDICESLTEVGEPISQTAEALYKSEILPLQTPVLIRLDQYEDLLDAVDFDLNVAEQYKQVVNKFLWTRDPNVSFKIGSRPYALTEKLKVYGLGLQELEKERHYHYIDLTVKLGREENTSSWLFPKLADDVVKRRLKEMGYPEKKIIDVFGQTISPYKKAQMIVKKDSRKRALGSPTLLKEIPELKLNFLSDLAMGHELVSHYSYLKDEDDIGDLLSAKLGIAWILQDKEFVLPSQTEDNYILPWNTNKARWWKKERINQALLQISSNSGQRTIWCGKEDILTLSGSNILIFLNICREIWRIWHQALRVKDKLEIDFDNKPIISTKYQSAGIYAASSLWYNKVIARTKGDSRKKLLDKIAKMLSTKLKEDKKMSYPGSNGFSLAVSDYEGSEVKDTLMKAVRYGDFVELHHTPKNKNQERRRKWYLLPILSPELDLPASHTKEPFYMNASKIKELISEAQTPDESELKE
jgi:hypothetical protein